MSKGKTPPELIAVMLFMAAAAAIALAAGLSLLVPGTPLDILWSLKKDAVVKLGSYREIFGIFLVVLAATMAASVVGLKKRHRWAWVMALVVFILNGIVDAARFFMKEPLNGVIGVVCASLFIWLLLRAKAIGFFIKK